MPWKSIKDVVREQVALLPVGAEFTSEEIFRRIRPRKDISILRVARILTQFHGLVSNRDSSHRPVTWTKVEE